MTTLKEFCDDAVNEVALKHLNTLPQEVQEKYSHLDLLNFDSYKVPVKGYR